MMGRRARLTGAAAVLVGLGPCAVVEGFGGVPCCGSAVRGAPLWGRLGLGMRQRATGLKAAGGAPTDAGLPPTTAESLPRGRLAAYFQMCRLENLPAAYLFVLAGAAVSGGAGTALLSPHLQLVALCTTLITVTSMVSNDYFDYRVGTDSPDLDKGNVISQGQLSLEEAKAFVSRLYASLLLLICLVQDTSARLLLMGGSISTFLYTKHLKPITLVKNVAVAFVCSLAPLVGGLAVPGAELSAAVWQGLPACTFLGILHREVLMDIPDEPADRGSGIRTLPVVFGAQRAAAFSCAVATAMSMLVSHMALGRGLLEDLAAGGGIRARGLLALRLLAGILGSGRMAFRAWKVRQAQDPAKEAHRAIEESAKTFPLVLLAFL
mmetsp:Transcript_749/g.2406  ORF Transcript_749/g.2406 Transcript_749/m.2406 type:complete len:379 (-) Transcript_749:115-1251(-)